MAAEALVNFLLDVFNDEQEERNRRNEIFQELRLERRQLRDASDPFNLPSEFFIKYYRMTPEVVLRLIALVENQISGDRCTFIPAHIQVLVTLRFMAEGALQKGFSQDFQHPVAQSTASICIHRVVNAINSLADIFITFPNREEQRDHIQNRLHRTIRIPGIIGLVDGFIVKFRRSTQNEEAFFNYRHGSSMNVQIIADSEYNILNIRICPGSNNDRYVWQFSEARESMQHLRTNSDIVRPYYILGDSGYTPSTILLTPVLNAPEGSAAYNYTQEHVRTRCKVEQTIGVLSNVWRVISKSRQLCYSPEKVAHFINAAAILHNFRIRHGIFNEIENEYELDREPLANDIEIRNELDYQAGLAERNRLINQYY